VKTIFEKSNGISGVLLTDEKENLSFIDGKFLRNADIGLPQVS